MLRAFEAFGRLGGVRKAALDLDVDHAVVSRHLRSLEAYVGTSLIERSPKSDAWLTADGQAYHGSISAGFREIAEATDRLRRQNDANMLICCSPGLAYHWLMPRLPSFRSRHSQFELSLRPTDIAADFFTNEVDGDIRYLRSWETTAAKAEVRMIDLASPPVAPVASPHYLHGAPPLERTSDLLLHRLLHEDSNEEWRVWLSQQGVRVGADLPGDRLWHAHLSLEAALKGQGVALSNPLLWGDAIDTGKLVVIQPTLGLLQPVKLGRYVFVAREDRWRAPAVARFREWLAAEFDKLN